MKKILTVLAVAVALVAAAERRPFERYQSIIDRQMFGEPPPGFDPTKPPSEVQKSEGKSAQELTKEQEQLKSAVHFSVINVTPEGTTAVGFTDNSDPKLPKHYYLKLGEERDGWLVKEADPVEKSMLIVRGAVELSLKLGENSAGGGTPAQAGAAGAAGRGGQPGGLLSRRRSLFGGLRQGGGPNGGAAPGAGSAGGTDINSLRGRRLMRQEQERQAREADETAKAEAAARKAEEDRQAAEEKERQAKEREEQRQQLQAIQEELRRAREARQQREQQEASENGGSTGDSE